MAENEKHLEFVIEAIHDMSGRCEEFTKWAEKGTLHAECCISKYAQTIQLETHIPPKTQLNPIINPSSQKQEPLSRSDTHPNTGTEYTMTSAQTLSAWGMLLCYILRPPTVHSYKTKHAMQI